MDAVYIAVPHPLHAPWAIRAAQVGDFMQTGQRIDVLIVTAVPEEHAAVLGAGRHHNAVRQVGLGHGPGETGEHVAAALADGDAVRRTSRSRVAARSGVAAVAGVVSLCRNS